MQTSSPAPAPTSAGTEPPDAPAPPAPAAGAVDDLDRARARRRSRIWVASLSAALLATLVGGVAIGPVTIAPEDVVRIVGHHLLGAPETVTWSEAHESIVWRLRVPRVLLGAAVGAGLAICGVALQAMVRNVLADPYLLGVTSGASTGAAAAILFGVGAAAFGEEALAGSAFVGALGASALVFLLARVTGRITSVRLLMSGVAVGYALYAATSFLIFASPNPEGARSVLFWLLGTLSLARWSVILAIVLVVVALTLAVLLVHSRALDALAIGDETALTLGMAPGRVRARLLVALALCIGAVVAAAGGIGFVGLVMPHLARRFVGGAHRRVLPVAALMGAVFLVWADVFARTVVQPQELPIGILTSLVGAPFLLLLVRRLHAATD